MNNAVPNSLGQFLRDKLNANKAQAETIPEFTKHRVFLVTNGEGCNPRYIRDVDVSWLAIELADKESEVETVFIRQGNTKDRSKIYVVQAWNNRTNRYQKDYFFDFNDAAAMINQYNNKGRFEDISINTATLS